jgi:CheY-like chemotaxis protein
MAKFSMPLDPLSSLSHKIRTPLTIILSTVNNFLDGAHGRLNSDQRDWMKKLEIHTTHLDQLVTEILGYLRAHPDEAAQVNSHADHKEDKGAAHPSPKGKTPALPAGKFSRKSPVILVVDDEPDIRDVVKEGLTSQGYAVETASTGEEAQDIARRIGPDLILMDVFLKDQNGLDVSRKIRAHLPQFVPVLLVTGQDDLREKVGGSIDVADDILSKPFQMVELFARVGSMLKLKSLSEEVARLKKEGEPK